MSMKKPAQRALLCAQNGATRKIGVEKMPEMKAALSLKKTKAIRKFEDYLSLNRAILYGSTFLKTNNAWG